MLLHNVGVSGCKLQLTGRNIVRKTSPTISYNLRLVQQSEKQRRFTTHIVGLNTPTILSSGYDNDLYWFDMKYIRGKLFNETFQETSKREIDRYIEMLIGYVEENRYTTDVYTNTEIRQLITAKLVTLRSRSYHTQLIDFTLKTVDLLDFDFITKGTCHGDLTFSNILFSGDNLYLIDFLDSYIESYVMDLVKLKQDLCHHWYLHLLNVDNSHITRISQIFSYIWKQFERTYPIVHTELFSVLDVVNILRIEPYLTNQRQIDTFNRVIRNTAIYEKFNRSNDG